MQPNTHDQNLIKVTTTSTPVQAAKPPYDRILLGIDQHAEHLRIDRQLDGAGPQPPQRVYPGANLEAFIKKQLAQAHQMHVEAEFEHLRPGGGCS